MIDEELKKSSEEQGTEETNAGKTAEQEAPAADAVKNTETTESDAEEDTITQDLMKGYTYKGQVVRHSMVKVKK